MSATTLSAGNSVIARVGGTSTVQLNAISRAAQGTLSLAEASLATTDTLIANGILGGWATIDGDWAINSTNAADGAVTALSAYIGALPATTGSASANYTLTGNQTQTGAVVANTVKITNTGTGETLALGGNNLTITAASATSLGGILYAGGGDGNYTIAGTTGRIVPSTNNQELIFHATSGSLTVNALVAASAGSSVVTKSGTGTLVLGAANNFTGAVRVNSGALRLTNATGAGTTAGGISVQNLSALELANGITVGAEALTIIGSGVAGGGALRNHANANTYGGVVTIGPGGARIASDSGGSLTLSGGIVTSLGNDVTFGGAGTTTVQTVAISGLGNVIKDCAGTLILAASNGQANTTVNGGQLNINQFAALGTPAGTLTMAAGTSLDNTSGGAVTITNPKSIAPGNSLTFAGTNDLDLGEGTTTLSATTTFTVSANTLTLSGDVVGAGYGIVKEGTGTLRLDGLSGTSSFTGNSTINAGTLLLEGSAKLGGGSTTIVTLGANGFLEVGASASLGNVTVAGITGNLITTTPVNANQDFTVSQGLSTANGRYNGVQTLGSGVTVTTALNYLGTIPASATAGRIVFENGATLAATGGFSINPVQGISLVAGTATVSVVGGQAVFFESAVAGSGGLTKTGAGNLRLTGSNTYLGGTVVDQGILGISSGAALGDVSGSLTIDGAILAAATNQDGSGTGATIDSGRTVRIGNGKTSGLHAQNGLTLRYDGVIAEIDSLGTAGAVQFGLTGPRQGTVILGGANTYRGDTTLSAGTLKLGSGGSFASSPRIIVGDAAGSAASVFDLTEKTAFSIGALQTLMGKGTVLLDPSTALTINGLLSPGNSPGLLTYDGGGTVTLAGTTLMEFDNTTRGTGYDAIDLLNSTNLNLGGALQLSFSTTFDDGTSFSLFTPSSGSSLAGTFSTISMVGIAYGDLTFTNDAGLWTTNTGTANQSMAFDSGTGTLSILAVPEPATLALAGLGLAAGLGWHLRRRRA